MNAEALRPAVVRIELLHGLLILGLWATVVPARMIEPRALFLGALFMGVNFLLLSSGIHWLLTPFAGKRRIKTGIALLVLKLALFLGLVSLLFVRTGLDPLSFMLGFSSLLVAIVLERLWALRRQGQ